MIQLPKSVLLAVPLATLVLSGCTTTSNGPVTITKVNPYHLQTGPPVQSQDEMILHEERFLLHGALESEEYQERLGNYFSIFWTSKDRVPATVRFEYCQAMTGPKVYTKEIRIDSPKRKNVTKFEITGTQYQDLGKVTQWRASIIENGSEAAEYRSYLWR